MTEAEIAVIIPVFKQPGLLTEAVSSALAQQIDVPYALIIVNDGCPYEETHLVAQEFATAYPDKILYVRRANGGLSAARNTGIEIALTAFPELQAVYFLDADNRLEPYALQRAYAALCDSPPEIGWAYPDIHKFGFDIFCDMKGKYRAFTHLTQNYCEAGSMVRRSVIAHGVRFDENMRMGYEDWEFWLQCIDAGFRGVHVPDMGFCYRQRAESMLKESERHHQQIIDYIHKKHASLFTPYYFIRREHEEAPRFAIYIAETDEIVLASDPHQRTSRIPYREFEQRFIAQRQRPEIGICPDYLFFTSERFVKALSESGLLSWLFWRAQQILASKNIMAVTLSPNENDLLRVNDQAAWPEEANEIGLIACRSELFHACAKDPHPSWILSLSSATPQPSQITIDCQIRSQIIPEQFTPAASAMFSVFGRMHARYKNLITFDNPNAYHALSYEWETKYYTRKVIGLESLLPVISQPQTRHVAMLMPICKMGGVERVAFNYAAALKKHGFTPHLLVAGHKEAQIPPYFANIFHTVNFFTDPALSVFLRADSKNDYMGTVKTHWADEGNHNQALSLLAGMDAVINCHCYELNPIMSSLRRMGVRTYSSQHLVDVAVLGHPQGIPHELLAYEHAYDGVIVISHRLREWFIANSVPENKLIHIPNAPSYPMDEETIENILLRKAERTSEDPLRVLFLGRFDRQKGMDRLAALIEKTNERQFPVEWRVVGSAVLGDGDDRELETLRPSLHPPARTIEALNDHYAWADIMVLPSRYEGVPLTLLEAGRLGCVSLATDVGAVREAMEDGRTGFLFNNELPTDVLAHQMCSVMTELWQQRPLLKQMTAMASLYHRQRDWNVSPLIKHLNGGPKRAAYSAAIHRHKPAADAA